MPFLKQSTTQTIRFGPFLDATDGVTEETALTITQALRRISKDGGAFAQSNHTGNSTHDSDGWYTDDLDATDTNTVGELILNVQVPATHLPVWMRWWVLEEDIYDAIFGASAAGFDSNQRVDVGSWLGTAATTSATTSKPEVDAFSISDNQAAADNVQSNIGNLDAAITSRSTVTTAEVNTEVDTALSDVNLDHLVGTATGIPALVAGTYLDQLADDGTATFDRTTDSLQAIRDRGDAAWTTGGGGSIRDILNVVPLLPTSIDLPKVCSTGRRFMLTNALDDLPTTAEIDPGTISIERKAIGGTSWSAIVTDSACSESAGLVYFDEVFDSGTGYAEGDSIRVTFKSQKITVSANDYEVSDATGRFFYTEIRQTMRGTDNAALASVLGALADAAAAGDPTASDTVVAYLKQVINTLEGTAGIPSFPAEAAPGNNVSLAETLRAIHADVTGLNGDAMRGTDSAALASVCTEARLSELDAGTGGKAANQIDLIKTEADKIALSDAGAGVSGSVIEEVENRATPADMGMPQQNQALSNIEFLMVDSTDHVTVETGLTVSGQRSIDGGAFASVSGSIAEVGSGIYQFDAAAADMNGRFITFRFTATGADDRFVSFITRP